jgi:hypothetical protein
MGGHAAVDETQELPPTDDEAGDGDGEEEGDLDETIMPPPSPTTTEGDSEDDMLVGLEDPLVEFKKVINAMKDEIAELGVQLNTREQALGVPLEDLLGEEARLNADETANVFTTVQRMIEENSKNLASQTTASQAWVSTNVSVGGDLVAKCDELKALLHAREAMVVRAHAMASDKEEKECEDQGQKHQERQELERQEQERLDQERQEQERREQERQEQERRELERQEQERRELERQEQERREQEERRERALQTAEAKRVVDEEAQQQEQEAAAAAAAAASPGKKRKKRNSSSPAISTSSSSSSLSSSRSVSSSAKRVKRSTPTRSSQTNSSQRSQRSPPKQEEEEEEEGDNSGICILTTGVDMVDDMRDSLQAMGAELLDDVKDAHTCTHLVAFSIKRSLKFLLALSACQHVLAPAWLQACVDEGHFVSESKYALQDPAGEEKFSMTLDSLLKSARGGILNGYKVHFTKSVMPGTPSPMELLVKSQGGVVLKTAPRKKQAKCIIIGDSRDEVRKEHTLSMFILLFFLVIQCSMIYTSYTLQAAVAKLRKLKYTIHDKELVLSGVLSNKLSVRAHKLKEA